MDGSAPDSTLSATVWHAVCAPDDIVPNLGVAALVDNRQLAIFRVRQRDGSNQFYAIDNFDPQSDANVLSRGLTGSLNGRVVVASPIYKHHYDLITGECLEDPATPVRAYAVRIEDEQVWVAV